MGKGKKSSSDNDPYRLLGDFDIICGRDARSLGNPGNRRFRDIVSATMNQYLAAPFRKEKSMIVRKTIEDIKRCGGRFLELKSGVWEELNVKRTQEKVGHCFRDMTQKFKGRRENDEIFNNAKKRVRQMLSSMEGEEQEGEEDILTDQLHKEDQLLVKNVNQLQNVNKVQKVNQPQADQLQKRASNDKAVSSTEGSISKASNFDRLYGPLLCLSVAASNLDSGDDNAMENEAVRKKNTMMAVTAAATVSAAAALASTAAASACAATTSASRNHAVAVASAATMENSFGSSTIMGSQEVAMQPYKSEVSSMTNNNVSKDSANVCVDDETFYRQDFMNKAINDVLGDVVSFK